MAFHHVVLFFTIIFLWHILVSAQISSENQKDYLSPQKSRNLYLHQPIRSTRKISQRAFQDLDLFTARGYGKRENCAGRLCDKRNLLLSGARLYGKRNSDMNQLKCFFFDCMELKSKIKDMDFPSRKYRREDETVLPD